VKVSTEVEVITETTKTSVSVVKEKAVLDGTNADELINKFANAKESIKALEAVKNETEQALRELLGEAKFGTIAGVERIKVADRTRTNVDSDLLKKAFPEAYEACSSVTSYNFLVVAK